MKPKFRNLRSLAIASSALLCISYAQAQSTLTWDAGGGGGAITNGGGAWLGANLWNNAGVAATWTSGDNAIFGGPATAAGNVTLASPTTAGSLTFNPSFTGTYTLGTAGQALTINDGIIKNASSAAVTFVSPIILGGEQDWTNNSTTTLTINAATNLNGNALTITGSGYTRINGVATNIISGAGGITVDGTRFEIGGAGTAAAHTYSGDTTIIGNSTVLFNGNFSANSNINLNGGVLETYWTGGLNRTIGTAGNQIRVTGGESGFAMNGSNGATFTLGALTWGTTNFNPTKLLLQNANSQGTSALTLASAINLNGADRTVVAHQGTAGTATSTISGAITNGTGTAGLIKEGAGVLILSSTNTYNGNTTVSAGTLTANTTGALPGFAASGRVTVAANATLSLRTGAWTAANIDSVRGATTWSAASSRLGFDTTSANFSYASNITEALAVNKLGTNTLTLTGNNSYTGGTVLTAGTLSVGSATAIPSTGTISFNGGTIQSSDATLRTFANAIALNSNVTVGTTGNLTFSNTGATALGATRTFTIGGGNTTFAQAFSGSGVGITKAGNGTLTLTGANTYTGLTTVSAGKLVLNNGTVSSSRVSFTGSNTSMDVLGGSGVNSTWNAGGGEFGPNGNNYNNVQVLIDGKGTEGSARIIGVGALVWGRTASNSTLALTDGGQMTVNGEVRIGNPYYNTNGNSNITIGGGTATSTFTGNTGQAFYIGFGERENSNNNVVTVSSGGVLTSVGNMFVGDVNDQQGNNLASTANKLAVTGTGTASMVSVTVGNARRAGVNAGDLEKTDANLVEILSGGTLTTSGANFIGRATQNFTQSNSNTMTVSGTGSSWAAGNQNLNIGLTTSASAFSNNNSLTVGSGGTVTGIATLTIGTGAGTETGNKLVVNGGSLTATTVAVQTGNSIEFGVNGGTLNGNITNNGAMSIGSNAAVSMAGNISGSGAITHTGTGTTSLSGTNTYNGGTTVSGGALTFLNTNAKSASGTHAFSAGTTLGLGVSGASAFTSTDVTNAFGGSMTGSLAGITVTSTTHVGIDTRNGNFTYSDDIAGSPSKGLTKLGANTLIIEGANTYTGATTVSEGTLLVNGSTDAGSTVGVSSGATLGGTGTIAGAVNVSGVLSPGASIETLGSGTLSFANGSSLVHELDSSVGTSVGSDLLKVTGDLNLAGTVGLTLSDFAVSDVAFNVDDVFSMINYTGTWNGGLFTFEGNELAEAEEFTFGLNNWRINYSAPTGGLNFAGEHVAGSFVNLTVIPEPSSVALLGTLGAMMLLRRRR